jgi:hypothetical protein
MKVLPRLSAAALAVLACMQLSHAQRLTQPLESIELTNEEIRQHGFGFYTTGNRLCSMYLLSANWAISAAHCGWGSNPSVRLGNMNDADASTSQVVNAYVPDSYSPGGSRSDLMLLKLRTPLFFVGRPRTVSSEEVEDGEYLMPVGGGRDASCGTAGTIRRMIFAKKEGADEQHVTTLRYVPGFAAWPGDSGAVVIYFPQWPPVDPKVYGVISAINRGAFLRDCSQDPAHDSAWEGYVARAKPHAGWVAVTMVEGKPPFFDGPRLATTPTLLEKARKIVTVAL